MKKFGVKHLIAVIAEVCAVVFLVLCMATDINDELFLPLALGCNVVGMLIGIWIQAEVRRNGR